MPGLLGGPWHGGRCGVGNPKRSSCAGEVAAVILRGRATGDRISENCRAREWELLGIPVSPERSAAWHLHPRSGTVRLPCRVCLATAVPGDLAPDSGTRIALSRREPKPE